MLRLLLMRHAKSDWSDGSLADVDRPLNGRGKRAATAMGRYMRQEALSPDLILCSAAQRTRETLARLLPSLPRQTTIRTLSSLYVDSETDYIGHIRHYGDGSATLMVIGHNPATEDTAMELTGTAASGSLQELQHKFPSGALAVMDFEMEDWAGLLPETGYLERFIIPRSLTD